jgi:hypothetical protein
MPRLLPHAAAAALASLVLAAGARAAELPTPSVASLFQRLPELPATAEEAARWVDKNGRLVHPGLLALRAEVEAHRRALEPQQLAAAQRHQQQSAVAVEDLGQGMAGVGIDMARLQRDPAYAQQVQDRLRQMSPQEMVALSQKMNQPLHQDQRYQNQAQAMAEDPPVVRAAAEAGEAYVQGQPARFTAHQALWQDTEAAVEQLMKKPLALPAGKPRIEWDNIGCDAGCRAQWESYAAKVLPLMIARDTEALRIRRGAFQRDRAAVAEGVKTADRHLVASRYGAASRSQVHQMHIMNYDGAALAEISQLIDRATETVQRAAVVVHCGPQVVLVPMAVCR